MLREKATAYADEIDNSKSAGNQTGVERPDDQLGHQGVGPERNSLLDTAERSK